MSFLRSNGGGENAKFVEALQSDFKTLSLETKKKYPLIKEVSSVNINVTYEILTKFRKCIEKSCSKEVGSLRVVGDSFFFLSHASPSFNMTHTEHANKHLSKHQTSNISCSFCVFLWGIFFFNIQFPNT